MRVVSDKRTLIILLASLVFCMGIACQSPTTTSYDSNTFSPSGTTSVKLAISGRFLLLHPGDTAVFKGTHQCSSIVDGRLDTMSMDSIRFRSMTCPPTYLSVADSTYVVYPQLHEYGSISADSTPYRVTRYFDRTSSGIRQRAYVDNNGLHVPKVTMVIPETLVVGNSWQTSQLVPFAYNSGNESVTLTGHCFAEEALYVLQYRDWTYLNGMSMTWYYALNGQTMSGGKALDITGTIVIRSYYFKDIGLLRSNITARIQRTIRGGETRLRVDHIHFDRGDTKAPLYP